MQRIFLKPILFTMLASSYHIYASSRTPSYSIAGNKLTIVGHLACRADSSFITGLLDNNAGHLGRAQAMARICAQSLLSCADTLAITHNKSVVGCKGVSWTLRTDSSFIEHDTVVKPGNEIIETYYGQFTSCVTGAASLPGGAAAQVNAIFILASAKKSHAATQTDPVQISLV